MANGSEEVFESGVMKVLCTVLFFSVQSGTQFLLKVAEFHLVVWLCTAS